MLRTQRRVIASTAVPRCGSAAGPVLFGILCFLLVLGVSMFVRLRTQHAEQQLRDLRAQEAHEHEVLARAVARHRGEAVRHTQANTPPLGGALVESVEEPAGTQQPLAAVSSSAVTTATSVTPAASHLPAVSTEIDPAAARRQWLEAQLAAGEFGPALETASSAVDADERTALLHRVARAQMDAGEYDGAGAAIRRMPLPEARTSAFRERAARKTLTGGGSGADFTQLISLIQQETSGPWQDIDGTGGTISQFETGVRVDPHGLLQHLSKPEHTGRLAALGIRARSADLNTDMARPSPLRMVSLTRLERAVAERIEAGQSVPTTMQHLAGLSQVRYVFVFPDEGEIVIAGPAEAWQYNENGQPVGAESGRPTLQLDDLVTVLRTFSPDGLGLFNCLIVPRQEGLKAVKEFVTQSNSRGPLRSTAVSNWVRQLQEKLGLQDVQVNGVPVESRVARVIVEADYRMKLIGVGKLDGGKGIKSFFDLLEVQPAQEPPPLDALRWWLTMKYDALLHSPDHDVFEIRGSSVLCLSENELITDQGQRVHTGQADETNRLFAQLFTQHYAELAQRDLIFADLQNIFDLALVAALIRHERLDQRAAWDGGVFAANGSYQPAQFDPPRTVMSVAGHRVYNGKDIVVQVAGGVRGDLMAVVRNPQMFRPAARLGNLAQQVRTPQLSPGRWWWDAPQ